MLLSITTTIFAQLEKKPLKIGDEIPVRVSSNLHYKNAQNTGVVFSETFESIGASYVKIHFKNFDLKPGDYVRVFSPLNNEEFIYSEKGKIVGENKQMISAFWSSVIWSSKVIVELHSFSQNNMHYGFDINTVAYGYSLKKINMLMENDPAYRAICGADNKENIVCYEGTEMSRKAEAVCRLLIGGSGLCTGWLLGCEGNVMTNNHCIGNANDANNTDFLFNYKYDDCAGTQTSTSDLVASTSTFVQTNSNLDFTLVALPTNPTDTYGYLSLSSVAVTTGERIYIPQHPGGVRKQIAVNTDAGGDPDGFAMVTDPGPARVEYMCDTEGGSSGSPVIRYSDNLVIAIHNTGGCPNGSSGRSDNIINAINNAGNMPNCAVDDNNPPGPFVSAIGASSSNQEGTDCSYQDVDFTISIAQAASANADVSFMVNASSTATVGVDFDILTPTLTFLAGDTSDKTAMLRIYNDSYLEGDEVINIDLSLNANGGDAQLSNLNTLTHTIHDNDLDPSLAGQTNFAFDDFEGDFSNWTVTGLGNTNFAIGDEAAATSAYWNANGNSTNFAFVNDDACDCDMSQERMTYNTTFDFSNMVSVTVDFDYSHVNSTGDLAYLQVSTDGGITWTTIGDRLPQSAWTHHTADISAYAGQPNVMVSIFYNDVGAWGYGLAIDNFTVDGLGNAAVQTAVNNGTSNANLMLPVAGTVYAYDAANSNVMASLQNNDGFDYGCLDVSVTRAGTSAQPYYGSVAPELVMDKSFFITANNSTVNGDNTITFYFTEAEIAGWETAIANAGGAYTRADLHILRDATTGPLNLENAATEIIPATIGVFDTNVTLTGNFTGIDGTFAFGPINALLDIEENELNAFSIYPNPVGNQFTIAVKNNDLPIAYEIYSLLGQTMNYKKIQSSNDLQVNATNLATGLYFINIYTQKGKQTYKFLKK